MHYTSTIKLSFQCHGNHLKPMGTVAALKLLHLQELHRKLGSRLSALSREQALESEVLKASGDLRAWGGPAINPDQII